MSYSNQEIAEKLAKLLQTVQQTNSSFSNGTIKYNNESYQLPSLNSLKRKTYLINR